MNHDVWRGFEAAIVRIELPEGSHRLEPRGPGDVGVFPFSAAVHVVTAFNPGGRQVDAAENDERHAQLLAATSGHVTLASVGSAPDGSMAEPGCALCDVDLTVALDLGRRFGQAAIYRWTAESLSIVGVDDARVTEMGWVLEPESHEMRPELSPRARRS